MKFSLNQSIIQSKTILDYLKAKKWVFEDIEIAALIFNKPNTNIQDILSELKEFSKITKSKKLKKQIFDRIELEQKKIEFIMTSDSNFMYGLELYEYNDPSQSEGNERVDIVYFKDFNSANKYAIKKKAKYGYTITKYGLNKYPSKKMKDSYAGFVIYDKRGNLKRCQTYDDYFKEPKHFYNTHRFEDYYVLIPNPFKRGNVVYSYEYNSYGVIRCDSNWESEASIPVEDRINGYIGIKSFQDSQIVVNFLMPDGSFMTDHCLFTRLELVDIDKIPESSKDCKTKEDANLYALKVASKFMDKCGWIEEIDTSRYNYVHFND